MEILLGIIIGGVVVGVAAVALSRRSAGRLAQASGELVALQVEHAEVQTRLTDHDERFATVEEERDHARGQLREAEQQLTDVRTQLASVTADHDARLEEMARAREQLDTHFKGIASEVVQSSSEEFLRHANEQFREQAELANKSLEAREQAVSTLVQPVREKLGELQVHVDAIEKRRIDAYSQVHEMVEQTRKWVSELRTETGRLSEALHSSQVRGSWGEQQLLNVVEAAGLKKHVDFFTQKSIASDDGHLRPDVVVKIPGNLQVVIDAKTPLDSYLKAQNAKTEKERTELLQAHADALLGHARELEKRDYQRWVGNSPDFVIMFVGADRILEAAQDARAAIWNEAWNKHRVLISTPGLLIAFLQTVAQAWKHDEMQKNVLEINTAALELCRRLYTYADHVNDIKGGLARALAAYNRSVGSFQSRVLVQARRIEELGAVDAADRIEAPESIEGGLRQLEVATREDGAEAPDGDE